MERRLAAILVADVVGYSRLIAADEAGTLAALKTRRVEHLQPLLERHKGRLVKLMGDGVLLEFASAVSAVQCAVALQASMTEANKALPEDVQIIFRIGVNLGEVVVEGDDIFGDGINVAARLEAICEPGGVCLSDSVHRQIRGKINLIFEDLGEQNLKNIVEPTRAYRIVSATLASTSAPVHHPASTKPSIAVLPLTNLSGDPEQEYFSDGITEDIITELSRFRSLFVIARNSSFQYRGKAVDVRRVARELGVRFVVEGSIRRSGKRIRITAQLVNAATGHQVWADRYDRHLQDIFAVQEELAQAIAATLEGRIAASGAELAGRNPTQHWGAYDYFLRGRECVNRYDGAAAEPLFRHAIELDPNYAQAHAWQSLVYIFRYFADGQQATLDVARQFADKALLLDPADACSHRTVGAVSMIMKRLDQAGIHFDRAVSLNPTDTFTVCLRGLWLAHMGRAEEALQSVDAGLRRDPFPPPFYWEFRGVALFEARRHREAIDAFNEMAQQPWWCRCYLAACYAHLGMPEEARSNIAEVLRQKPDFSISDIERTEPFQNPADLKHLTDILRKVGLPE
jgi:TolB-like protein/class 3 adenylate cyclase